MMSQAFLVVGHRDWGKSHTLRALTGGSNQVRYIVIGNRRFFIRRMSNDDRPAEWKDLMNQLDPNTRPNVIVAVCPTLEALPVLRHLRQRYALFFWIMRTNYHRTAQITPQEERNLAELGAVEIFDRHAEEIERAAAFRNFVETHP